MNHEIYLFGSHVTGFSTLAGVILHDFKIVGMKIKAADIQKDWKKEWCLLKDVLDELLLFNNKLKYV